MKARKGRTLQMHALGGRACLQGERISRRLDNGNGFEVVGEGET